MFPIVVGAPVLPVVPVVLAPVVVAPRFQGWVGFAPAWEVHMDWMEDYEYMIWHRWQRMIAHRHLSVIERRRMLLDLIRRENRFESTKKVDRLADRMLGMEEDLGADEWGHVVSEETTTTTTTTTAQQQQQQRREQEEERMNVRRVNAANGLVDAARESGNQDIASLKRTQEMILAGQMDDLVLAQEEEQQQSGRVSRRKKTIVPATPGPPAPVPAMTAPPTPGPATPRRLQGRSNAGGHSYSSQSLQQSFEAPMPQAPQTPMPQPQYQPQAPPPAPTPPQPAPQSATYNYNQEQFQQSVQTPKPAPPPRNQNYQQGVQQQYNQSIQQQQAIAPPTEKPKRPKNRENRSSKRHHHHYTQTTTTTTVTTSNTTSDDVEEDDQQSQCPGSPYGQQPYGQPQFAPHPQQTPHPPGQITQSGDLPTANFSGQMANQSGPMALAGSHPGGAYPGQNPAGLVPSNDFGQVKKKKEGKKRKKEKTPVLAGNSVVGGEGGGKEKGKGKGQGEKEKKKKKKKKYDEL